MKLQSRAKEEPEINVISLVDVLLVLVLFFMVSTTFMRESEISLRLPEASAQAPADTSREVLDIAVAENGTYVVNGRALVKSDARTLRAAIERLIGDTRELPVSIRADAKATHQSVITAMDVVGQLGFVEINIATVTPDA